MSIMGKAGYDMKKRKSTGDIVLDTAIYLFMIFVLLVTLYPMWYVVAASFASSTELIKNPGIMIWPENAAADAYKLVFENPKFLSGFVNILKIMAIGLPINLVMTLLCGYFMACKGMLWKRRISLFIMFTMFFGGGLIPSYLNIRSLGLYDTIWALVLPSAMSVYNAIICKTAIEAIPESLSESAYLDGAQDFQVLFKIIMPLIKPTMAVLLLYYGVAHWNSWFSASVYIRDEMKLPLQNILRQLLMENENLAEANHGDYYNAYAATIKYAAIVVSTVPILCIYPFLQKYFVKGVMIGAVKG